MSRQTTVEPLSGWAKGTRGAMTLGPIRALMLGAFALGALGLCGIAGCGTPPGVFIIVQNQVLTPMCTVPATLGTDYRGEGTLDLRLVDDSPEAGYMLFPLLQNDFPPAGGEVDGNRIALSGFDVDIGLPPNSPPGVLTDAFTAMQTSSDSGGIDPLIEYSTLTSGSVASGGGNTASSVTIFPGPLAARIRAMGVLSPTNHFWVMASVRARGKTLASDVKSDAFKYPIELCDGCLVVDTGACSATNTPGGGGCTPGQDSLSACCEVTGTLTCQ
jgi:hypothetical protein